MTIVCALANDGVALRLATYLDCQGRALGENGFQLIAGGIVGSLLTGLVTIFIALIGYRLILGPIPGLRDGVTWTVRLGLVLALATSWPAFQTLIYRVAVDGPDELAAVLLPATGLYAGNAANRIQAGYDALRLGTEITPRASRQPNAEESGSTEQSEAVPQAPATPVRMRVAQPPLPQTASLLVVFTAGVTGALRIGIGLLLALGPLVLMGLLFDASVGLVTGWLRALAGAALALLAATIVTALELTVLDDELERVGSRSTDLDFSTFDPQALSTIVLLFGVVMLVATVLASRIPGALRLSLGSAPLKQTSEPLPVRPPTGTSPNTSLTATWQTASLAERPPRAAAVADAVTGMARRQHNAADSGAQNGDYAPSRIAPRASARSDSDFLPIPLGVAGRRSQPRQSRAATLRDRGQ